MRRPVPALAVLLAACGPGEPASDHPPPATPSRVEAGVSTARTAEQEIQAAQRQGQARIDSQMRAATDTGSTAP